jgi:hypothetical protein
MAADRTRMIEFRLAGGRRTRGDDPIGIDSHARGDLFTYATLSCLICPPMLGGCVPWEITRVVGELATPRR